MAEAGTTPAPTRVVADSGRDYLVGRRLASGGMAEVYLAAPQSAPSEIVAIKRMLPRLASDPEFGSMFRDEAALAAQLQHPHIVSVPELGVRASDPFFVMEYVHGAHLRALLKQNTPLPLDLALHVGVAVADALDYAHERCDPHGASLHIVHRDVSPTNVIVTYDGTVKLLDFGIAKTSARLHVTRAGTLKGKIAYMSPEQCRGDAVDRRSDVFALGLVLYEITTGTRAFRAEREVLLFQEVQEGLVDPPSTRVAHYPRGLEEILMHALGRDASSRFATAAALRDALLDFARAEGLGRPSNHVANFMTTQFGHPPLPALGDPSPEESTASASTSSGSRRRRASLPGIHAARTRAELPPAGSAPASPGTVPAPSRPRPRPLPAPARLAAPAAELPPLPDPGPAAARGQSWDDSQAGHRAPMELGAPTGPGEHGHWSPPRSHVPPDPALIAAPSGPPAAWRVPDALRAQDAPPASRPSQTRFLASPGDPSNAASAAPSVPSEVGHAGLAGSTPAGGTPPPAGAERRDDPPQGRPASSAWAAGFPAGHGPVAAGSPWPSPGQAQPPEPGGPSPWVAGQAQPPEPGGPSPWPGGQARPPEPGGPSPWVAGQARPPEPGGPAPWPGGLPPVEDLVRPAASWAASQPSRPSHGPAAPGAPPWAAASQPSHPSHGPAAPGSPPWTPGAPPPRHDGPGSPSTPWAPAGSSHDRPAAPSSPSIAGQPPTSWASTPAGPDQGGFALPPGSRWPPPPAPATPQPRAIPPTPRPRRSRAARRWITAVAVVLLLALGAYVGGAYYVGWPEWPPPLRLRS